MKSIKKIIAGIFLGIGVGTFMNLIFSYIYGAYMPGVPSFLQQYDNVLTGVTIELIIFALLGIIQVYATKIMKNEERGILKNTIIHYFCIILPLIVAGYILHWGKDLKTMILVGIGISIIYFIIWLITYLSMKAEIRKINSAISKH